MTLHSFDNIDDAIDATRAFLWPFDLGRWAKLAFVAFFLGGVGASNPFQFSGGPGSPGEPGTTPSLPSLGDPELVIVAGLVAVVLGFMAISAIMAFVFVESLRRETVTIRRYWSERWTQGLRLFGFRLVVGVLVLGVAAALLAAALGPALLDIGAFSFALVAIAIPVLFAVALVSGLINGFTTSFVVPIMIVEDRSVLSAWRRFWPTLTEQWKEYLAYAVLRFVLQIAAGIVLSIAVVLALIVLAIPLGIVAGIGVALLSVADAVGIAIIAFAAGLFVLASITVSLFAVVPVQTYLHYYALLVLGDTNETFDLIKDRRTAIRE